MVAKSVQGLWGFDQSALRQLQDKVARAQWQARFDVRFAEIDGKLRTLYLMNGNIIASLVIPLFWTMA